MNNNNMEENTSNQEGLNKKSQPTFLMIPDSIRYINGLSQSDIIVYCVIYQYCKASSFDGNPIEADTIVTNEEIANRANISPISVVRAIKKLKESGIIKIYRGKSGKRKIKILCDFVKHNRASEFKRKFTRKEKYKNQELPKTFYKVPETLLHEKDIKLNDVMVYGVLYNFMQLNHKNDESICNVSGIFTTEAIAERANCSITTANRSLTTLKKKGIIKIENESQEKRKFTIAKDYL